MLQCCLACIIKANEDELSLFGNKAKSRKGITYYTVRESLVSWIAAYMMKTQKYGRKYSISGKARRIYLLLTQFPHSEDNQVVLYSRISRRKLLEWDFEGVGDMRASWNRRVFKRRSLT